VVGTVERRGMAVTPAGGVLVLEPIGAELRVASAAWGADAPGATIPLVRITGMGVIEALEWAPDGGLYALGNDPDADDIASRALYRVCLHTGAATKAADLRVRDLDSLAWGDDGMLYATDANGREAHLYRIDPSTGALDDLGPIGVVGVTALSRAMPEPMFRGCG